MRESDRKKLLMECIKSTKVYNEKLLVINRNRERVERNIRSLTYRLADPDITIAQASTLQFELSKYELELPKIGLRAEEEKIKLSVERLVAERLRLESIECEDTSNDTDLKKRIRVEQFEKTKLLRIEKLQKEISEGEVRLPILDEYERELYDELLRKKASNKQPPT